MPTSSSHRTATLDTSSDRTLRAGRLVFRRYRLEKMVGRGGMGVVWRAFDTKLDRVVALKFLPEIFFMDPAARDDLKRETKRSLELTHPHIVRIHDFVDDEETAAISMEYVDGATLSQRRVEQPARFFECEALHGWTQGLCHALDYAHHTACCVHRDLKPTNLMITARGVLKVTDFGISCGLHHTAARVSALTSTGGTLGYMSPQQLAGELAAPSDDIYSLGATLYELLTSKPPFYSGDLNFQIRAQAPESVTDRRRQLGLVGRPIDPRWEETIAACLAKDPRDRPAEVLEVARALGLSAGANGLPTPAPESAVTILQPRAVSPPWQLSVRRWFESQRPALAARRQKLAETWGRMEAAILQPRVALPVGALLFALAAAGFWPHHSPAPVALATPAPQPATPAPMAVAPVLQPRFTPTVELHPEDREYLSLPAPEVAAEAPAPPPEAPATPAKLQITTTPAGIAFRVLRGAYESPTAAALCTGFTPALVENLPVGACRVELAAAGLGERSFSVRVGAEEVTKFEQTFPHGTVKIQSTPPGAEVYCDDLPIGTAPVNAPVLPGAHTFRAEQGDQEARSQTANVKLDGTQQLTFDFRSGAATTTAHHTRARIQRPEPSTFTKVSRSISSFFGGGSSPAAKPRR